MNKFTTMKCAAVMLPALVIGTPLAQAAEKECDCPCESERTTVMNDSTRDGPRAEQRQDADRPARAIAMSGQSDENKQNLTVASRSHYLATLPTGGYHSDSLIGREVMNRADNKSIGEVNNLVLDAEGQLAALTVSVGGILGLGEHDVAIAWDQFERGHDGEQVTLSIDLTDTSLKNAPKYAIE
ncbi:MAG: hypothetical protein GVY11_04815 [Gammaproteobacteria bacterium]|jgi:sporulation protein YlmC with PRC-barrel domain|nr:hypothetical protein [Gammaproteobacteria bacterium]